MVFNVIQEIIPSYELLTEVEIYMLGYFKLTENTKENEEISIDIAKEYFQRYRKKLREKKSVVHITTTIWSLQGSIP